ncbi:MAG: NFACT RNA binding domain-containing protein [Myxococcota bacterium]|nr:NFACT RNA binding domain-containing protein [Myxococcota bacterium]
MLSLAELRRLTPILAREFSGHVVERWVQPDGQRLAMSLYGARSKGEKAGGKRFVLLSSRPGLARLGEIDALPRAPERPPAFVSFLRSHLSRARMLDARLIGDDRVVALRFAAREGEFDLVLSILGQKSNLYLLDSGGVIRAVLRSPADTRPELTLGTAFEPPVHGRPQPGEDRFEAFPDSDLLREIEAVYSDQEEDRAALDLARALRQTLRRESKNAQRRLEKLEAELAEAEQANALQRQGELLKTALGRVEAGSSSVEVDDFETGERVRIPLDPARSPKENLEILFKRYQKFLRRLTKAGGQIDAARASCDALAVLVGQLEAAAPESGEPDPVALAALAAHPDVSRWLDRRRAAQISGGDAAASPKDKLPARLRGVPARLLPRRYLSRDGLEIWVGRHDAGNDHLSTRLARGNDLFFHLDGAPGSHVVLRTEGRPEPPQESLLDAAELAVHFSKQKNASRADVHVVPIKQVKKPRGAKAGLVWVTGGRSLHLRREESRLKRLLKARIES